VITTPPIIQSGFSLTPMCPRNPDYAKPAAGDDLEARLGLAHRRALGKVPS
jgi:hypothetical protein